MTSETRRSITAEQQRPPLWRNGTFLKWAAQVAVLVGVLLAGWILISTALANLQAQGLQFDWEFLRRPVGFGIPEGFATQPSSGLEALLVGVVNSLRVISLGLVLALVLGVVVGISRLSKNWLVSRTANLYVETIRNVPLLLQILFWNVIYIGFAPLTVDSGPIPGWFYMSSRGVSMASFFGTDTVWQWLVFVAVGLVVGGVVYRLRFRRFEETGHETRPVLSSFVAFVVVAALGWFLHPIAGALGWAFSAAAAVVELVPALAWAFAAAAGVATLTLLWVRRFFASFRSPAGMAKLTDDDWFRVVFAGVVGFGGVVFLVLVPGFVGAIEGVVVGLLEWIADRFEFLRAGAPLEFRRPEIVVAGRFPQYGPTGLSFTTAFLAILTGLVVYTASFIAEIVRAGIQAVPNGQTEAAEAVGLKRGQILRLVVLPQAFRIVLPPLGNQFLNLTKNSSLAIAVGYPDIVQVGQTLFNQTGRTVQVILIWMAFYLTLSLLISANVNRLNRKLKLVER